MRYTAEKLLRPTWAEISLAKLQRNFARVRQLAGPHRQVMAVVKADAYGHGAVPISQALAESGCPWFGVATVEEALELRQAGIRQPILLLGGLYMSDPADLIHYRLIPSVSSTARLDTYAACARRYGQPIRFHLKVDTGMGRLGLPPERVGPFLEQYRRHPELILSGLLTHLASAEDWVSPQTSEQMARFREVLSEIKSSGLEPEFVHVSNSAALLAGLQVPENLVRIGALLYGYCLPFVLGPHQKPPNRMEFEPILSLKSRVVFLKDVPASQPLGYGGIFRTRRPSRIATVPVGYADGLSRGLSNCGRAIIRDHSVPMVGNISMDLTLLDVTDIAGVEIGDEVILIGNSGSCSVNALEMAQQLNTVPYEVLCAIGQRVPRIYLESG